MSCHDIQPNPWPIPQQVEPYEILYIKHPTLDKINISPENGWLGDVWEILFSGAMLV